MSDKPNTIVKLVSKNYKCLKAITVVPNGPTVTINGPNGSGKTSCLDSIVAILSGKICDRPIRQGSSKAEIECEFGDFKARLSITEKGGPSLRVWSKSGVEIAGPRTFLKDHSNEILLDPVGFMRLGETPDGRRKQAEKLRQLVGLDFTALNQESKQKYDERTDVNREVTTLKGKLANFPEDAAAPKEEVRVSELMGQLKAVEKQWGDTAAAAREHNRQNEQVKARWELTAARQVSANEAIKICDSEIHSLVVEIARLQKELLDKKESRGAMVAHLAEVSEALVAREKEVAALVYKDLDEIAAEADKAKEPIREQITKADELNQRVRTNRRRKELLDDISVAQTKSDALSARLGEIEQDRQKQLASVKYPIEGLSFDDSGILLNGLPLNQGSQAQQIKAVVAMGLAFKPKIPVILVKDASILDQDSLKEMAEMAAKAEGQVWLETIESEDPSAIEIVDGSIREEVAA
jgi:recombinational DNA repair ATPase RecF